MYQRAASRRVSSIPNIEPRHLHVRIPYSIPMALRADSWGPGVHPNAEYLLDPELEDDVSLTIGDIGAIMGKGVSTPSLRRLR